MSWRLTSVLAVVLPVVAASCSKSTSESSGGTLHPSTGPISQTELQQSGARDAYDAVQRLRPRWLVVRSMRSFSIQTVVVVFQDNLYLGNQDELRRIGTDGIYSIEYIDGATAQATLPGLRDIHVEGAIRVHMAPPK